MTTTTQAIPSCAQKARIDRATTGSESKIAYCLGNLAAPAARKPDPAATMIAAVFTLSYPRYVPSYAPLIAGAAFMQWTSELFALAKCKRRTYSAQQLGTNVICLIHEQRRDGHDTYGRN
jgi:hypothetical protein